MLSTFNQSSKWLTPHPKLEGVTVMDHLFARMNGTYPNKWRSNFRDENAVNDWKSTWAEAFDEDGITLHDVAVGIKNCRHMFDWPPSLTEFMRACRPDLDPEVSFHEAVHCTSQRRRGERGDWTHPAIYHAALKVGQHEILNCAYSTLKVRWSKALSDELARGEWAPVPDAMAALPEPRKTEMSDAEAKQAMQRLGTGDVLKKSGRDPRAWAKKIVGSQKGRSPAVISMAKKALEEVAA